MQENEATNLSALWSFSESFSHSVIYAERKRCFMREYDSQAVKSFHLEYDSFRTSLHSRVDELVKRGKQEIGFWQEEIKKIECYSREQAIQELIEAKKIHQKIAQIRSWIGRLPT